MTCLPDKSEISIPARKIYTLDIADPKAGQLIAEIKPDVLNHHAAQMDVRRSVADPTFDARINIIGFINLLEACKDAGVKTSHFFLFGRGRLWRPGADPGH